MSYWASKLRHGLLWGWHRCVGDQFPICRDNYEPCDNIAETTEADTLIKFGNEWGKSDSGAFQHPKQVTHTNWRFLDNPEYHNCCGQEHTIPQVQKIGCVLCPVNC